MARGPAVSGLRAVIAASADGRILVPFGSYAGQNSGIFIESLTTFAFQAEADRLFGFTGSEKQARTAASWLDERRAEPLLVFAHQVASAYRAASDAGTGTWHGPTRRTRSRQHRRPRT